MMSEPKAESAGTGSENEGHVLVRNPGGQRFHFLRIDEQATETRFTLQTEHAFQMVPGGWCSFSTNATAASSARRIARSSISSRRRSFSASPARRSFLDNAIDGRTTKGLFGEQLHSYVITDAIRDENALRFSVEYLDPADQDVPASGDA